MANLKRTFDFTTVFEKIQNDYCDVSNSINDTIKYQLIYKNVNFSLLYTTKNGQENTLFFVATSPRIEVLFTLNVTFVENKYLVSNYFDSSFFYPLAEILGYSKNNKFYPSSLLQEIKSKFSNLMPVLTKNSEVIRICNKYKSEDCPYYKTTRRVNMSPQMEEKIKTRYVNSKQIIGLCKKSNKTLVFTSNINYAKKLVISDLL